MAKVNQDEALEWAYTSSLLVFFHEKDRIPNGNYVSYNIAPGEETTFTIKRVTLMLLKNNSGYFKKVHFCVVIVIFQMFQTLKMRYLERSNFLETPWHWVIE